MSTSKAADENKFKEVRKAAFALWEVTTNRKCEGVNDNIDSSYECKWQERARSQDFKHISLFCSLGDWANNVTDILKDNSCDKYAFFDYEESQALFRYYTRMLLVTSEMLTDFQDIVILTTPDNRKLRHKKREVLGDARKLLSDEGNEDEINHMLDFINRICKHKAKGLHQGNHHLPICFEDYPKGCIFVNSSRVGSLEFKLPRDAIQIPKLSNILMTIIGCYNIVDKKFNEHPEEFKKVCEAYELKTS